MSGGRPREEPIDPKQPPPANEDRKTVEPQSPGADLERKEQHPATPDDGAESAPDSPRGGGRVPLGVEARRRLHTTTVSPSVLRLADPTKIAALRPRVVLKERSYSLRGSPTSQWEAPTRMLGDGEVGSLIIGVFFIMSALLIRRAFDGAEDTDPLSRQIQLQGVARFAAPVLFVCGLVLVVGGAARLIW